MKAVPHAPAGIAGLLDYHGSPVPVLDLHEMVVSKPAESRYSTRLVLIKVSELTDAAGQPRVLGLLVERATGTLKRDQTDFVESGLNIANAPYLGTIAVDSEGFIQRLRPEALLTPSVRALLTGSSLEAAVS